MRRTVDIDGEQVPIEHVLDAQELQDVKDKARTRRPKYPLTAPRDPWLGDPIGSAERSM